MEQKQLCPNCGADMRLQSFIYVCDFCGTRITGDGFSTIDSLTEVPEEIEKRHSYLTKNRSYINSSPKVSFEENGREIKLTSNPRFYANDGKYNKVLESSIFYTYSTDGISHKLRLAVKSAMFTGIPQMSILLDMETVISPRFDNWDKDTAYFDIDIIELQRICESHVIMISSDILNSDISVYEELIPYSCRFYHFSFDKRKYIYSIHRNLITD